MHQLSSQRSDDATNWERRQERHRTIIFVARKGMVSDRLKQGIERAFPWTVGVEVETIAEASRIFPNTVSLILVESGLLTSAEYGAEDLFRLHPLALTAVLDSGASMSTSTYNEIMSSKLVRGVLPIHVRLDISLSIVALLLRGIEYYPRAFFSACNMVAEQRTVVPTQPELIIEDTPAPTTLFNLTKRESQILELVERGLQNKSIAATLNLSEHTVKIHLHNIITKLGAHNRTEAAAFFRSGRTNNPYH